VESGTLSTPAISSICNSSWKRRTSTSRLDGRDLAQRDCTFPCASWLKTWCKGEGFFLVSEWRGFSRSGVGQRVQALRFFFFERCQSITRWRAMAKSHASNLDLPSYWWPRSRTRIQVLLKEIFRALFVSRDVDEIAEQAVLILLDPAGRANPGRASAIPSRCSGVIAHTAPRKKPPAPASPGIQGIQTAAQLTMKLWRSF